MQFLDCVRMHGFCIAKPVHSNTRHCTASHYSHRHLFGVKYFTGVVAGTKPSNIIYNRKISPLCGCSVTLDSIGLVYFCMCFILGLLRHMCILNNLMNNVFGFQLGWGDVSLDKPREFLYALLFWGSMHGWKKEHGWLTQGWVMGDGWHREQKIEWSLTRIYLARLWVPCLVY